MKTSDRPFEGLLGNTVELRVLERLIASPESEFNVAELSNMTGVHRDSASKVISKFLGWNILLRTTKGKMDFFRLNSDEPLVMSINALNDSLIRQMFPEAKAVMEGLNDESVTTSVRDASLAEQEARIETVSRKTKKDAGRNVTANYDHFMSMDVSQYAGQWVAICDEKVVAHSPSFKDVYRMAKDKCGRSKPFIVMVPTSNMMIV